MLGKVLHQVISLQMSEELIIVAITIYWLIAEKKSGYKRKYSSSSLLLLVRASEKAQQLKRLTAFSSRESGALF